MVIVYIVVVSWIAQTNEQFGLQFKQARQSFLGKQGTN
jgi:hypothetical protein